MIDFRYHLISLIAVFLALGLGILMGSVVLSEKYVQRLEQRVDQFGEQLDAKREEVAQLNDRVAALQDFSLEAESRLVEDSLLGEEVVLFEMENAQEGLADQLAETVDLSGGTLVSTVTLTDRFALGDQPERDQLALILGSSSGTAEELRNEAAREIGTRAAAAAGARVDGGRSASADRLQSLIEQLEDADFLGVSSAEDVVVPAGAAFIVVGGGAEEPRSGVIDLALRLSEGLSSRDAGVVVTEPAESLWGLVPAVRDDGATASSVSTIDHADTVPGRVATALGLEMAIEGLTGHYGTEDGASAIVPPPTPRA